MMPLPTQQCSTMAKLNHNQAFSPALVCGKPGLRNRRASTDDAPSVALKAMLASAR